MTQNEAPRVLFLSSALGSGHDKAAQGLIKGLAMIKPAVETRVVDAVGYVSPILERAVEGTYIGALRIAPDLWGHFYEKMRRQETTSVNPILAKAVEAKFGPLIDEWRPDLLVSTHPFCCSVGGAMKKTWPRLLLVATVTDFDMHAQWANEEVDLFVVGAEPVADLLRQRGIAEERILPAGMPIDPAFAGPVDLENAKRRHGLADREDGDGGKRRVVLVMGGGLGIGPMAEVVRQLGQAPFPLRIVAITGKNSRLRSELLRAAERFSNPTTILGYVDDVYALMRLADVLVTKPGGMTVAEALASGVPLVVTGSLPGQEMANTDFVKSLGVGVVAKKENVRETVLGLLADEPRRLAMAAKARALGRPRGAVDAARAVLELWEGQRDPGRGKGERVVSRAGLGAPPGQA